MNKKGMDLTKLDSLIVRNMGHIQSGWINIGKSYMKKGDLLYRLVNGKAALIDITLIPGETTYFVFMDLAKKLNLDFITLYKEYYKQTHFEDGVLIADTYKIPVGLSEKEVVNILIERSLTVHKKLSKKFFGNFIEKKWFRIVTIASIIQKESGSEKEMPLVSSVIFNRVKKRMPLQMDGTLNYGRFSHIKVTPKMIRDDNSDYNTYKSKKLPSNPVCIVSKKAIFAAINPAKTDYLYFVRTSKGKHTFTKSYKKHIENFTTVKN